MNSYRLSIFKKILTALTIVSFLFLIGLSLKNKIQKAKPALTTVTVYFLNTKLNPIFSCIKVFPVSRQVEQNDNLPKVTLEALIAGVTPAERAAGYLTSINSGVIVERVTIYNKVVTANFDSTLENHVAGSCRVQAIRAQITKTLKQFDQIKKVIISINGRTRDILKS